MSRTIDFSERHQPERSEPVDADRNPEKLSQEPRPMRGRNYAYMVSEEQLETMTEIGRFRTIPTADLQCFRYQGNNEEMNANLRSLQEQGLVQRRSVWSAPRPGATRGRGDRLTVVVLSKKGKALLEKTTGRGQNQMIYAGLVKPAEVHHDAAIYRMYQVERRKIERAGGRINRVVLDYEIKKDVYQPLAKIRALFAPETQDYRRRQAEIAAQNRLKVVDGKILLPDLRIEFTRASGEQTQVDLELATHHYRGSSLRAKADAGFKMYAPQDAAGRLAPAYDPELVAQIFFF